MAICADELAWQCHTTNVNSVNLSCHYPCIGDFELSQYILRHVVLGHRVDNKVLISRWAFAGPVLVTFVLKQHSNSRSSSTHYKLLTTPFYPYTGGCSLCPVKNGCISSIHFYTVWTHRLTFSFINLKYSWTPVTLYTVSQKKFLPLNSL